MKILIIRSDFCAFRVEMPKLAEALTAEGHDVTVVQHGAEPCSIRTVPSIILFDTDRGACVLDCEVPGDVDIERVRKDLAAWQERYDRAEDAKEQEAIARALTGAEPTDAEVTLRALIKRLGEPTREEKDAARAELVAECAVASEPIEEAKP